ncbi:NAD(P)-dependent dehydrogenase, short-chain alcohol dehydrogenase family [Roseivivax halotolerans]|uniref:NAD(P)-dependent dehydrogenase, short-chain alcohol dehydrogenase family n=1 Tax=Roseivivax halotolerans TaxID=93684 RepID=A0A1I5ZIU2_9RHOB|nr:SDR family oxidoreductase [Roseivivax halotolerans]SFQ56404.1 NAD(P)-dependent dehydrogenase, short-chain alcohol dehydrogenase family [Roseivivax halotolerans]
MQIDNQTVIVTGGGSGLGEATARHFASLGARVAIFDLGAEQAEAVATEIGGRAFPLDVTDADAVGRAVETVASEMGGLRAAVNCAGIAGAARVVGREGKLALDLFEKTIRVNLFGTYNVMSHAARAMSELDPLGEERGVVINTASIAYEDGQLGQTAYAASKGAIAALCLPAARDLAKLGIRVAAIAPGLFNTPMMQGLPPETTEAITSNIPFPARLGAPDEYARMAAHIVENSYINGTTIRLDGAVRLPQR